ncbi:MAG: VanZ family protein [Burkholderiaceae bacterium]
MRTAEAPRAALASAFAAYLAFIAYQSLAGAAPGACVVPLVQQGSHLSRGDGFANLVAYVPLGLLAAAWAARRRARAGVLAAAFASIAAFSLAMETLQACLPGRVSSWYDWSTNSAGGLLGLMALPVATRLLRLARTRPALTAAVDAPLWWPVALCVGTWMALSLAPWRFTLDVGTIRGNLSFLRHLADGASLEPWRLARHLLGWTAIGVALRALPADAATTLRWLALLSAVAALGQVVLDVPALSLEELAGMALALPVSALVSSLVSGAGRARLPAALALSSVLVYQLAPHAGAPLARGVSWWPQVGRGGLLAALELALCFGWLGAMLTLSLRWSALRGEDIGRRRIAWPLAAVVVLMLTELAQAWIPGRTPDTSAPLLTALAFAVAWALTGAPLRDRAPPRSRRPVS